MQHAIAEYETEGAFPETLGAVKTWTGREDAWMTRAWGVE